MRANWTRTAGDEGDRGPGKEWEKTGDDEGQRRPDFPAPRIDASTARRRVAHSPHGATFAFVHARRSPVAPIARYGTDEIR